VERGKSLYDTKCHACHDRSVHNRASRKARSYAAIRREVVRWEKSLGGGWSKDEVEDVTLYLNETHYKLPCPEAVCKQQRPSGNIAGTARAAESPAAQ
jgi:ribosomal protein L44E